jgi:hypothetical protein
MQPHASRNSKSPCRSPIQIARANPSALGEVGPLHIPVYSALEVSIIGLDVVKGLIPATPARRRVASALRTSPIFQKAWQLRLPLHPGHVGMHASDSPSWHCRCCRAESSRGTSRARGTSRTSRRCRRAAAHRRCRAGSRSARVRRPTRRFWLRPAPILLSHQGLSDGRRVVQLRARLAAPASRAAVILYRRPRTTRD